MNSQAVAQEEDQSPTTGDTPAKKSRRPRKDNHPSWQELTVFVLAVAYAVLAAWLSIGRTLAMISRAADAGVFTQAFWSYNHGQGFFEALNYGTSGTLSLLALHPAPLLYPLAFLYRFFPTLSALLILQAMVVGAAAIPLFYLTRDITRSDSRALIASALYLVWIPVLSGNLFDFHLEAFFPLEIFTLVLLWNRGSYLWAIIPAGLAVCTEEIGPIFVFCVAVFFLLPPIRATLSRARSAWVTGPTGRRFRNFWHVSWQWFRVGLRKPGVIPSLLLGVAAVGSYIVLRIWQTQSGLGIKGTTTLTTIPLWEYPIHTLLGKVTFAPFLAQIFPRLEFWFLILALVAFLPFFAPRTFIISAPWIVYTLIVNNVEFTSLGIEYGLLSATVIFVGVAYGLNRVGPRQEGSASTTLSALSPGDAGTPSAANPANEALRDTLVRAAQAQQALLESWEATGVKPTPDPAAVNQRILQLALRSGRNLDLVPPLTAQTNPQEGTPTKKSRWAGRGRPIGAWWTSALILVIFVNIALSPIDPYITGPGVNAPGYTIHLGGTPAFYASVVKVADMVPSNASVLASQDLFPFVANNVQAYTLGVHQTHIPFVNCTELPDYVFLAVTEKSNLPTCLVPLLWDQAVYNVLATVGGSAGGPDYLFEHDYHGEATNYYPVSIPTNDTFYAPSGVSAGGAGVVVTPTNDSNNATNNATNYGTAVTSIAGVTGTVWTGTTTTIPNGPAVIQLYVSVVPLPGVSQLSFGKAVLDLSWSAWGIASGNPVSIPYSYFANATNHTGLPWVLVTYTFTAPFPLTQFSFAGTIKSGKFLVTLNYYTLSFPS